MFFKYYTIKYYTTLKFYRILIFNRQFKLFRRRLNLISRSVNKKRLIKSNIYPNASTVLRITFLAKLIDKYTKPSKCKSNRDGQVVLYEVSA